MLEQSSLNFMRWTHKVNNYNREGWTLQEKVNHIKPDQVKVDTGFKDN